MRMEYTTWFSAHHTRVDQDGPLTLEEQRAKESLSSYAFNKIWKVNANAAIYYNNKRSADNLSDIVWPCKDVCTDENSITIPIGGGYNCKYIKYHAGQCGHELNIDPSFIDEFWHHCWYNRQVYNKSFL